MKAINKIMALTCALALCLGVAGCSKNSDSSSDASSAESTAANIDYDVDSSDRLYDGLVSTYKESGYVITGHIENSAMEIPFECAVKGDQCMYSSTTQGMKSSIYLTAEKKLYTISEGTTTYYESDYADGTSQWDILFGVDVTFDKAEIDTASNVIKETYAATFPDESTGTITYYFTGDTKVICGIDVTLADETVNGFEIETIGAVSDSDVELPDLSSYTKS